MSRAGGIPGLQAEEDVKYLASDVTFAVGPYHAADVLDGKARIATGRACASAQQRQPSLRVWGGLDRHRLIV